MWVSWGTGSLPTILLKMWSRGKKTWTSLNSILWFWRSQEDMRSFSVFISLRAFETLILSSTRMEHVGNAGSLMLMSDKNDQVEKPSMTVSTLSRLLKHHETAKPELPDGAHYTSWSVWREQDSHSSELYFHWASAESHLKGGIEKRTSSFLPRETSKAFCSSFKSAIWFDSCFTSAACFSFSFFISVRCQSIKLSLHLLSSDITFVWKENILKITHFFFKTTLKIKLKINIKKSRSKQELLKELLKEKNPSILINDVIKLNSHGSPWFIHHPKGTSFPMYATLYEILRH